jgi:phage FluMu gp28-like protein
MAVHEGDVGLDEFAKHPNASLLWETAQGRVTWGYDLAVWSSHDGEDTLFNEFVQEARAGKGLWNLYYRVTLPDAIDLGLVETINRTRGTRFTREQFLADCKARARTDEIFQQAYLCNPLGASASHIAEWSVIERCRLDYSIERVHLESAQISQLFGQFSPAREYQRQSAIELFIRQSFPNLFDPQPSTEHPLLYLGFDVAASGQGDLAVIYIDEARGDELTLRALFTCRTEDWQFLKTVLFYFLQYLPNLSGAGDESGLGRQICWEAASHFGSSFIQVNFASAKHDLGFALMNQLSALQKRLPADQPDVAADFFALRKSHTGTRWVFSEGPNTFNPASHCDIAWAGALATHAHSQSQFSVGAEVG